MLVDQLAVQVNDRRVLNVVYSMTASAYRWRRASPTVQSFEEENGKLNKMVADLSIDKEMLLLRGRGQISSVRRN
jgi:hypothetical protein